MKDAVLDETTVKEGMDIAKLRLIPSLSALDAAEGAGGRRVADVQRPCARDRPDPRLARADAHRLAAGGDDARRQDWVGAGLLDRHAGKLETLVVDDAEALTAAAFTRIRQLLQTGALEAGSFLRPMLVRKWKQKP